MSCPKCQGRGARRWPLALVLVATALLAVMAFADEPPTLSLGDAVTLAAARQPLLDARAAAADALAENAVAAGQWPDPKFRLGLASLPVDTFDPTQEAMTQLTFALSQSIPGGDKARLAGLRGAREADMARRQLETTRLRVARDAALAWLARWEPERMQPLARKIENEWSRQIEWAEVAYKTGKLAQDEVVALRGRLETARDRLDELGRRQARGRAALERWLGEAAARPLADPEADIALADATELRARLDRHPELTALAEAISVARAEADQAREAYKPDLNVDFGYGLRGGGRPDFLSVGVGFDLPLFPAKRQDRRLAAREARVTEAEKLRADRRLSMQAELDEALADWHAARERARRYRDSLLPLARQRVESALNAYGSDRASFARVAEARRAELETRTELISLEAMQARARVQIDYLTTEARP